MKRTISILVILFAVLIFCACSNSGGSLFDVFAPGQQGHNGGPGGSTGSAEGTAIMVYMVGSDLESKSGAATLDLEEIAASGVDLALNSVYVLAGGTENWHNEYASAECNTVLRLTEDGFTPVSTLEKASMGDPSSLSSFINYCTEASVCTHHGLVLWDHGSGPVIGYGKDTSFDGDTLTLVEMREAMQATQFGPDNKLDWVGFDACLMSSAELACIWGDYANYLVASQEIEPFCGWSYAFMQNAGKVGTTSMLEELAQDYLNGCLAYYASRGVAESDTTLSVLDLSYAGELHDAIEGLFGAASANVGTQYNHLAAQRAGTRALGRATTGSEYDLVDILDMAQRLLPDYPAEAQALIDAVSHTVINNTTNAESLCGLSLYYPFYNKNHYKASWAEEYRELGVFENYIAYLEGFENNWLSAETPSDYASSIMPEMRGDQIALQLTPEEQERFACANYYILQREGDETYRLLFNSAAEADADGVITADFDGNIIYVADSYGGVCIPFGQKIADIGSRSYYSIYSYLISEYLAYCFDGSDDPSSAYDSCECRLMLDRSTGRLSVMTYALDDIDADDLAGGKTESADLSPYTTIQFFRFPLCTVARYDNGTLKPYLDWTMHLTNDYLFDCNIADGFSYEYAPLISGEYCVLFEIMDTSGNKYCSDMIPYTVESSEFTPAALIPEPEPITVTWDSGSEKVLYDNNGAKLTAKIANDEHGGRTLDFVFENGTGEDILCNAVDLTANGNIYCEENPVWLPVRAGGSDTAHDVHFGETGSFGYLPTLDSMELTLNLENCHTRGSIVHGQKIRVQFSPGFFAPNAYERIDQTPFCSAQAGRQVLYEDDCMRVTLLALYSVPHTISNGFNDVQLDLLVENRSEDRSCSAKLWGLNIDGAYIPLGNTDTLAKNFDSFGSSAIDNYMTTHAGLEPGMKQYICVRPLTFSFYSMFGVGSISKIGVCLETRSGKGDLLPETKDCRWVDLSLSRHAPSPVDPPVVIGSQTLYSGNDVRISIWGEDQTVPMLREPIQVSGNFQQVYLIVENNTSEDICITIDDTLLNGEYSSENGAQVYVLTPQIGAGQRGMIIVPMVYFGEFSESNPFSTLDFRLRVMNFNGSMELWHSDELIHVSVSPQ